MSPALFLPSGIVASKVVNPALSFIYILLQNFLRFYNFPGALLLRFRTSLVIAASHLLENEGKKTLVRAKEDVI